MEYGLKLVYSARGKIKPRSSQRMIAFKQHLPIWVKLRGIEPCNFEFRDVKELLDNEFIRFHTEGGDFVRLAILPKDNVFKLYSEIRTKGRHGRRQSFYLGDLNKDVPEIARLYTPVPHTEPLVLPQKLEIVR